MVVMSLKFTKKKVLLIAGVVVCAIAAIFFAGKGIFTVQQTLAETKVKEEKYAGKSEAQRQSFLKSFGWEFETEPQQVIEIKIPEEFDAVYEEYNSLQKTQGMDLSKYQGKRCKKYVYTVLNYPDHPDHVSATILVYNGRIVGGDISFLGEGGFSHGFSMPS